MSLTPGQRLGPYEIVAAIGAGGMGEVFRARDTKLHRDVAIKVLPDLLARDPERLARFEREAQVLASLNQPHIAAIYGFEDSTSVKALVMELIEGPTLDARIAAGPVPPAEAAEIARQIAEALEAAHDKGIVHRDLKPANIKLTADGQVKVLDFGLAKAMDPSTSGADLANSPTLTSPAMTQAGMLLGTAAYMSPEQARGQVVDKRADIWAFGVVLFEMLTGKRTFAGPTVSDTLAAVLRQDLDWTLLPAGTPAAIVALLRRCLERDPKRRLRDIGEARLALEATGDASAIATRIEPLAVPTTPPARFGLWHAVGGLLLVAVTAAAVLWWSTGRVSTADAVRVSVALPPDAGFSLAAHTVLAVSRDGSSLVMAGSIKGVPQLYLRLLREFEPRPLTGTTDASSPFFSPDGAWVGFFAEGKLKKVPAAGGPIIALADAADNRGGVWTDDGTIVYSPGPTSPLQRIPAAGGTPQPASVLDEQKHERTHRWPSILPDGKTVLFTVGSIEHPDDYDDATLEAVRLDTGARRLVLKGGRMAQYVDTGHLLFLRGKILYAVRFDPAKLEVHGAPVPVVDGVSGDTTTGAGDYAVSATGTIAYVPGDPSGGQHVLTWVDAKGAAAPIDVPPALYCDPKVSPDGRRLVVSIIDSASLRNVSVIDPTRGTASKLTFTGMNRTPLWSRDGRVVYYLSYEIAGNLSVLMRKAADGSGDAERVREIQGQAYLEDISADGGTIIFSVTGAGTTTGGRGLLATAGRAVIERLSLAGAADPTVIVSEPTDVYGAALSPDGRWLAYNSLASGHAEVYVQSFVSSGGRAQVSTTGGMEPHWSPDGRTIYYLQGDQMVSVALEPGPSFVPGRPKVLFAGVVQIAIDSAETYGVAPAGDRFIMMRTADQHTATQEVRAILNWFPELKRTAGGK